MKNGHFATCIFHNAQEFLNLVPACEDLIIARSVFNYACMIAVSHSRHTSLVTCNFARVIIRERVSDAMQKCPRIRRAINSLPASPALPAHYVSICSDSESSYSSDTYDESDTATEMASACDDHHIEPATTCQRTDDLVPDVRIDADILDASIAGPKKKPRSELMSSSVMVSARARIPHRFPGGPLILPAGMLVLAQGVT